MDFWYVEQFRRQRNFRKQVENVWSWNMQAMLNFHVYKRDMIATSNTYSIHVQ